MPEPLTTENLIALLTLSALEIVLGIDNVVFLSILTSKLPTRQQATARRVGLGLAMLMRIALLFAISWVMGLTRPIFTLFEHVYSGRDLILLAGGLFLVGKATYEVHDKLEGATARAGSPAARVSFISVMVQVTLLDAVFSLDSVITAVGMAQSLAVMVTAVVLAVLVMMAFASAIAEFIERHPTMKILALSFLILIGVMLVAEGFGKHVEKGYIYFAMAFSLAVELLNMRLRKAAPIRLHRSYDSP
jgi:predicted tellurium resistance membrane protein TerC